MKIQHKLTFIQNNHFREWLETRNKVKDEISSQQRMWCICGRLATGLHESNCIKFRNKVRSETVKRLKHLLITSTNTMEPK